MDVDVSTLARDGAIYSSTSSLSSSSITASSPQNHQTSTSSMHNQVSTAAVVCQTQGLNLANNINNNHNNINNSNNINIINNSNNSCNTSNNSCNISNNNLRESPNLSPGSTISSIPTSAQDKLNNSNVQQSHQIHLPLNAQVLNTNHQNIAAIMPALQHLGPGIRVIPGDTRQLLVTHTTGNNETRPLTLAVQNSNDQTTRPLIVQSNSTGETRPVALVVHSSNSNDNRVTIVHSNIPNQSTTNDVRPVTFVHSGNEGRTVPLVLSTHQPPLNVTSMYELVYCQYDDVPQQNDLNNL